MLIFFFSVFSMVVLSLKGNRNKKKIAFVADGFITK